MDAVKFSYKLKSIDPLKAILGEQQQVALKQNCAYANDTEVADTATTYSDPRKALEVAKRQAGDTRKQRIAARTWLEIGVGEEGATREFELQ